MFGRSLSALGIAGACVTAICCVTPLLPWALTVIGLGGLAGVLYRDAVLFPALALFLLIAGVGLWMTKRQS